MNNMKKLLILLLCAVTLVAAGVFGTLAYFTDSEAVTNTFTVGQVGITLDETDVNELGVKDGETRVQSNEYHLLPGYTYTKDPTVHVDENSESCWLYVKVENGIADIEAQTNSIATQIADNGWTVLDETNNSVVYYKDWTKGKDGYDQFVFQSFTIDGGKTVNVPDGENTPQDKENIADYADATVKVTAYAIQMAGFENKPADAWTALAGQLKLN